MHVLRSSAWQGGEPHLTFARGEHAPLYPLPHPVKSYNVARVSRQPKGIRLGRVCRGCGISAEELISGGEIGCPDCYESFGGRIFPSLPTHSSVYSARMPSARRKRLDRERRLTELRVELRRAIDGECFELAATLRDKIRDLEKQ